MKTVPSENILIHSLFTSSHYPFAISIWCLWFSECFPCICRRGTGPISKRNNQHPHSADSGPDNAEHLTFFFFLNLLSSSSTLNEGLCPQTLAL